MLTLEPKRKPRARELERLGTLRAIYEQQRTMYREKTNRIDDRIVSVSQPWIQPIKRGKAAVSVEFGPKLAVSVVEGLVRVEKFSFDAFNEGLTLIESAKRYKERTGHYPERILADKIYRNRENLTFCKVHGIRLSRPPLGRPAKDEALRRAQREPEVKEAGERNIVEAKFGEAKRFYCLDRILEKAQETTEAMICVTFAVINLFRILRKRLASFFCLFDEVSFMQFFLTYAEAV